MQTPKNRVSNINKIHPHTCIQCHFKSGFIVSLQFRQTSQIESIFHTKLILTILRYSTPHMEKSYPKPHQLPQEISHVNLVEKVILKMG